MNVTYSGFWKRFCAGIIDFLVILPFIFCFAWAATHSKLMGLLVVVPYCFSMAAYTIFLHAKYGQTLGKMALRIKVVTLDGNLITAKEALLRSSVDLFWALGASISFIVAIQNIPEPDLINSNWQSFPTLLANAQPIFGRWVEIASAGWGLSEFIVLLCNYKKRALHDFIAGTVVVNTYSQMEK